MTNHPAQPVRLPAGRPCARTLRTAAEEAPPAVEEEPAVETSVGEDGTEWWEDDDGVVVPNGRREGKSTAVRM